MGGFENLFGDPDELQRRMAEFAESMQRQQGLAWADNAIGLAVQMTVAAINRVNVQGNADEQAQQIRSRHGDRLPRGGHARARGARRPAVGPGAPASPPARRPAGLLGGAMLAARGDDLLEGAEAEDEHERGEAERRG